MPQFERAPRASARALIHASPEKVYDAFVEPTALTKFWLSKASAPLAVGKRVHWEFMVPGAADDVEATELKPHERIVVAWSDGTTTEWAFEPHAGGTVVTIEQKGFAGSGDEIVATALEATQGYTLVLAELKMLLEQGRAMNIVKDKAALIGRADSP